MAAQTILGRATNDPDGDQTFAGGSVSGNQVNIQFETDMPLPTFMQAMDRARHSILKHLREDDVA